jgi:hypothetical protein
MQPIKYGWIFSRKFYKMSQHFFDKCQCLKRLEEKYTTIGNQAMQLDREENPRIPGLSVNFKNYGEARRRFSAEYFIALISLQHDEECGIYKHVLSAVDNNRNLFAARRAQLSPSAYQALLQGKVEKWRLRSERMEEKLKESTSELDFVDAFHYWYYLVSFRQWQLIVDNLQSAHPQKRTSVKERNGLTAPIVATFCWLINETGIVAKGDMSNADYCQEICGKFNLPYTERVRMQYSGSGTNKHRQKVIDLIMPTLNDIDRKKIADYLSKPKQKMYA